MKAKLRSIENASTARRSKQAKNTAIVDPRIEEALNLQSDGKNDEAEVLFETILRDRPKHPAVLYSLAAIRQNRGEGAEALDLINRCLEAAPSFQQAHQARDVILKGLRKAKQEGGSAASERPA